MGIVVLYLYKNTSLLNDSLAYCMTVARGVGGGVNVGGGATGGVNVGVGDSGGGWVVGLVMVKAVVMVAVESVV